MNNTGLIQKRVLIALSSDAYQYVLVLRSSQTTFSERMIKLS